MTMSEPRSEVPSSDTIEPTAQPGPAWRWWLAAGVGAAIAWPTGWLLSYAAALPFLLGLFFYALFGLVIGAVVHRVSSGGRRGLSGVVGTTLIVAAGWGTSLAQEAADFPVDMASRAVRQSNDLGERSRTEFERAVEDEVRQFLRDEHGSAGLLGYVRWVTATGSIPAGVLPSVTIRLEVGQRQVWWLVRVVLSLMLFAFGVGSQTLAAPPRRRPAPVEGEKESPADD